MDLICVEGEKRLVADLTTDSAPNLGSLSYGEVQPVRVAKVRRAGSTGAIWLPVDISTSALRVGVGTKLTAPTSGLFTLNWDGHSTTLNYNFTLSQLNVALSTLTASASATDQGGGIYLITFSPTGAQPDFTATDTSGLNPQSTVEISIVQTGDGTHQELVSLRLVQLPAVQTSAFSLGDAASAPVTVIATGGVGVNHKVVVDLDPVPVGGFWTITVNAVESDFLDYNISADDLTAAIELLSTVGVDNVSVSLGSPGRYYITFIGTKAATNMGTITTVATALEVLQYMEGTLDLRDIDAERLLGTADSVSLLLEVEETPSGGDPIKLLREPVTLVSPVLNVV